MPWHKVRTYHDHHMDHRRRVTYRLDLSILLVGALMVLAVVGALGSFSGPFEPGPTGLSDLHGGSGRSAGLGPTFTQEVCGGVALVCLAYLAIAVAVRSK